ncbi:MAG: RNA methyltransferase [Gemmatimonadota bacterium]|nr:RNA methyltransferase [Gemmatimonadota bacterium]
MPLHLKNPHSILAVLQTRPQDVYEIRLPDPVAGPWRLVRSSAAEIGVKFAGETRGSRRRGRTGRTGGAEAVIRERRAVTVQDLFANVSGTGLWLALDRVQDPHNVGAIFRTAAFFGVRGILLTRDRSAPLTETVYDVASGGVEHVPFCFPANLSRALDLARKANLWILGASEHADTGLDRIAADRPWLLVMGNEERGLRRLTLDKCDATCRIPSTGRVASLNVSVAAGIFMQKLAAPPDTTNG